LAIWRCLAKQKKLEMDDKINNGILAPANYAFYANCLNACDTPHDTGGGFPSGTFAWKCQTALSSTDKVLVFIP